MRAVFCCLKWLWHWVNKFLTNSIVLEKLVVRNASNTLRKNIIYALFVARFTPLYLFTLNNYKFLLNIEDLTRTKVTSLLLV